MSPLILTLVAIAVFLVAVAQLVHELFFRYRAMLDERIEDALGKKKPDSNAALFKDLTKLNSDSSSGSLSWRVRLQDLLDQADLRVSAKTLVAIGAGAGVVLALIGVCVFRRWWVAPAGIAAGLSGCVLYVFWKRRRRLQKLTQQLPEAFEAIGRAVRAGQTTAAAFQIVGDDFQPPIAAEFRRCYEEQSLGLPYDIALRNLATRSGLMELRILAVALLVQSRSGGNLIELLNNLSTLARTRVKLQLKVKALTSEGRMQAAVLTVLPVLAFFILLAVAPAYVSTLLQHPTLLVATGLAQLCGALWIRQIVNFEF